MGLVVALAALTGCTGIQGYYVMEEGPPATYADLAAPADRPSVRVVFQFQSNGSTSDLISNRYRPQVERVLRQTGLFREVRSDAAPTDAELRIVMNNRREGIGGAVAQGVFSGLTFGLIGTRVSDHYVFEASYARAGGPPIARSSERELVSTSGLIKRGVSDVPNRGSVDRALEIMIEQELLGFLDALAEQGTLARRGVLGPQGAR